MKGLFDEYAADHGFMIEQDVINNIYWQTNG